MTEILIGYARCSTDARDLTAQRDRLRDLGVAEERIYLDHGLTGTNRKRPGLDQALAAVRSGDTLVVPKLDRLARSVPDARAIGDDLAARGIKLSLGGQVYDPADPMGKMFFNILATFAEFEVDLLRMRTREGMAVARAKGKLRGKQPKLSAGQPPHPVAEDRLRPVAGVPRPGPDPPPELRLGLRELPQPAGRLDLIAVLQRRVGPLGVPPHARRVGDPQLPRQVLYHQRGHVQRVRQERPQVADRGELEREAQAHVVAPPLRDQLEVGIVQVEHAVQLGPRWRARVAAERGCLVIGQELHRHARNIALTGR
jgi:DNA invertase Pin-like site-specific DNA recombinase